MQKDMSVVIGIGKPKRGPGAPPPFMSEKPEASAVERKEHAGMGMGMGKLEAPAPEMETAIPKSGVDTVMEEFGVTDPAQGKAFVRAYLKALIGDDEADEGKEGMEGV